MRRIIQGDDFKKVLDIALEWIEANPNLDMISLDGYMKHDMYGEKTLTVIDIEYKGE